MNITKTIQMLSLASVVILLSACGQDQDDKTAQKAKAPQAAAVPAPAKAVATPAATVPKTTSTVKTVATATPKQRTGADIYGLCVGCHGATGEGGVGPKLQGRPKAELMAALEEYKAGKQRGALTSMMAPNVQGMSEHDLDAVATYITTLK